MDASARRTYSGALPIAPGDVDVQTRFRENNQFIASLALYEVHDETAYSPLTRCRTPSPTGGEDDFALLERLARDTRLTETMWA